ncbi:MAG: hypothetical protein ABSH47_14800 [Bryobacteraceae bacterium]|jgi:hypothetical protein
MWFRAWPLLLLPVAALADSKIVFRDTVGGNEIVQTEYRQGRNMRWDSGDGANILNADEGRVYMLDLRNRTWTAQQAHPGALLVLAAWIRRPPRVRESGKTVDVWYDTTDTGERRQMFGFTASHLVTRERRVAEPGACSASSETVTDGWYIPRKSGTRWGLRAYGSWECHDTIVTHGTRPVTGFALLETVNDGMFRRTREVLEFSEQPLDPGLFEPPPGFRRVEAPETWAQRVESDWQQVERAFESWFD